MNTEMKFAIRYALNRVLQQCLIIDSEWWDMSRLDPYGPFSEEISYLLEQGIIETRERKMRINKKIWNENEIQEI